MAITALAAFFSAINLSFGQYRQDDSAYIPLNIQTQAQFSAENYRGNGQGMADAGKALLYSGAAFAMTGIAVWISDEISYAANPQKGTMSYTPFIAIADGTIGAVLALIGWPLLSTGKRRIQAAGGNNFIFGNDMTKGGTAIIEISGGLPNAIGISTTGGYNFNNWLFLGGGISYKAYIFNRYDSLHSLPVFANIRFSFGRKRTVPYIGFSEGYDITQRERYTSLDFGVRMKKYDVRRGQSWWFGSSVDFYGLEPCFFGVKAGRSF